MRALDGIRTMIGKFSDRIAASRRGAEFTCGDCERNERCGLPPHKDCPVKAAQLARDGGYDRQAPDGYYKAVWPR
jgi:hypothetical protein